MSLGLKEGGSEAFSFPMTFGRLFLEQQVASAKVPRAFGEDHTTMVSLLEMEQENSFLQLLNTPAWGYEIAEVVEDRLEKRF